MAQFRPPEKLNFSSPNWDAWRSSFQTFRVVTQLDKETDDIQIATLKYSMGSESEEVIKTFDFGDLRKATYDQILTRFDAYFKPRKNVIRLRRQFMKRVQEKEENVDTYQRSLLKAAEECEFLDKSERVRDQFLMGLLSENLIQRLEQLYLSNPLEFTLEKVVDYSKTYEDNHRDTARKSTNGKVSDTPQEKTKPTMTRPSKTKPAVVASKTQSNSMVSKQLAKVPLNKSELINKLTITNHIKPTLDPLRFRLPQ